MTSFYTTLAQFGPQVKSDSPLTYLFNEQIDSSFITGHQSKDIGRGTKAYRDYFSDRCALNFDGLCEVACASTEYALPVNQGDYQAIEFDRLNAGELLLRDISTKKYLRGMSGSSRPSLTVYDTLSANTPLVSSFNNCVKMYGVDPQTIDSDVVMNAVLDKPEISPYVLINIYNTCLRYGTLESLRGTKLYAFYSGNKFKRLNAKYAGTF